LRSRRSRRFPSWLYRRATGRSWRDLPPRSLLWDRAGRAQLTTAPLGDAIVVVVVEVVGVVVVVAPIAGTFLYLIFSGSPWPRISPLALAGGGPVVWMLMYQSPFLRSFCCCLSLTTMHPCFGLPTGDGPGGVPR